METELKTLLVSATRGRAELEGVSISHSAWPSVVHITPSIHPGFTGTLEDSTVVEFVYVPMAIKRAAQKNNLGQRFELTIQDLNEIIAPLIDLIPLDSEEEPSVELRSFVYSESGVSTVQDGPYRLTAKNGASVTEGFKATATPRNLTGTGTGRRMTVQRIPMLRGFSR